MPRALKPLWIEFSDIPWGSVGWRMGWGEKYWGEWRAFFMSLNAAGRERYQIDWPEPEPWRGLYAFIESGEEPNWAKEHKRKLAGPYPVPQIEESKISEHYRIVWLIRRYMDRLGSYDVPARFPTPYLGPTSQEDMVEFYSEPSGAWWRLSGLKTSGLLLQRLTQADAPDQLIFNFS